MNEFSDKSFSALWSLMISKEPYRDDFEDFLHLVRIMLVIPVSSAQCERTISAVNRIKSDVRSSLHPTTVESLIRISSEADSVKDCDPVPFIERWFSKPRKVHYLGWPKGFETEDVVNV